MVVWFINNSDLSSDQKQNVIDNLILLDDAEQTGQAFFAGSLDVAATWQPYLSYAEDSTDSHILFDTSFSNKLILDGIVFRADFAKAHPDVVSKFIDGIFMALEEYESDFNTIRNIMPMFAGMSDDEIAATRMDAGMMGYMANVKSLENDCAIIYSDMCDVWESIGETVNRSLGATLFDTSYVKALSDKYSSVEVNTVKPVEITEEQLTEALDVPSMLTKTCTIEFHPDTAKFMDNAAAAAILDEFVEMAKVLDGTIIQIEGNLNFDGAIYSGDALSTSRANAVKKYFIANGIDASRIIVVGNGNSKMLADPSGSIEDTMVNRRTDIFFKTVGA
jgi:outer membrane protein OmpA-like peptidoglycan-associated protein